MATPRETLDRAYGNMPKEVGSSLVLDFSPIRGIRYYWHRLIRRLTR